MASRDGEKFCLKWNNFENNISIGFRELRDDKDFFDVTLACDDKQLQAHKVILSACSPFFRSVLKKNPHQHPLLYLKGVKYEDILSVLNFMYHGEVNVAQEELNSFLAVAEDLQVKGLTQTGHKHQPTSQSMPEVKLPPCPQTPASNALPENARLHKQQKARTSYEHALASPEFATASHREIEHRDPYIIPSPIKPIMKTEDIDHDPELSSDRQLTNLDSDYPVARMGHEYQQSYQKMDTSYLEQGGHIGDTSQDFYSQHTRKASHGEYLCNLCDKRSRDLYAMKKHLEGKHEITPGYNCPVCNTFCKTKSVLFKHKKNCH